ncbi:hypothetical protein ABZ297_31240 [Nonomuraea sp. NPDC005983]|uniref:hypothetical protein n=1 Tax=Nonomuraea sp. NPDC005983 TaxID=3155595 RepID=UPI0033A25974
MSVRLGMRSFAAIAAAAFGAVAIGAGSPAHADTPYDKQPLLRGGTTASYFWDDSSGRAGDTGLPASGKPMQKGLVASPSWPLMTEGYVIYKDKKAPFFVGDRGPGVPSNSGVMLDLDAKTFAYLTGGTFNSSTLGVDGVGGEGHIKIKYVITKWGSGPGKKNYPVAYSSGAWSRVDSHPAKPPTILVKKDTVDKNAPVPVAPAVAEPKTEAGGTVADAADVSDAADVAKVSDVADRHPQASAESEPASGASSGMTGAVVAGGLALVGGGLMMGRDRIRRLIRR